MTASLTEQAPAKINLTLRVLGRRPDGYHQLESLVAFADLADTLTLQPGGAGGLDIAGPFASACGPAAGNLVLKAVAALRERAAGLTAGRFALAKNIPVAAGLGGGSADAAAALRLLARANGLAARDPRLAAAALVVGADVPVCLDCRARIMRGVGDELAAPLELPPLSALLVNPGVALATRDVFARFAGTARQRAGTRRRAARARGLDRMARRARQRSDTAGDCLPARHRRGAAGLGRLAGRPACPHVGVGADLLCAVCLARRSRRGGATAQGRTQGLVGISRDDPMNEQPPLKMPALRWTVVSLAIGE